MGNGVIIGRKQCPLCALAGRDNSHDNLVLFEDGAYCYVCRTNPLRGQQPSMQKTWTSEKPQRDVALEMKMIEKYPVRGHESRGISQATMERFGVKCEVDETTGEPAAYLYPYHNEDGEVVGYKKRTLPKQFSVIGKIKRLFGQKQCKQNAKLLIIVEGELDALSGWEILTDKRKAWNIVSIPNGANEEGTVDGTFLREIEWITSHQVVLLCLDNDGPGKATSTGIAELLASHTEVRVVNLTMKDTGKMLESSRGDEWFKCLMDSKPYRPEEIVEGSDLDWRDYRKNKEPGASLPYPKLQKMTWGLRKGEITLVVAGPGLGKSSFVREMCFDLSLKGYKIANIALETPKDDLVNTYIAMDRNIPPYKLMFNQSILSEADYIESFEKLYSTNNMNFFSWWGNIASERLINKMFYFAKSLKVDFIMLDHVSIACAGESDERLEIDKLFEQLTKLVVETGVGVIAVMHLRKVPGKSFNKGGEVELEDIRGSAGAAQMSWNVWALERNQQGDNKDIMNVRVLKNRQLGFTGLADSLLFSHETGRLGLLEVEY